jgi:hypothetical protein
MTTELFGVAVAAILTILLVAAWAYSRRQRSADSKRSERLREQFGSEYERTVAETGSTHKAEIELTARQKRVAGLNIRHLTTTEGKVFADEWLHVQADFVDDPSTAVHDADTLLGKVMAARGYPVTDFEQRSADMSVDHAQVLTHYRAAHDIALRDARGEANTEDLRQAVISSRMLFDELVERSSTVQKIERSETPVQAAEPTTATAVPVMGPTLTTPEPALATTRETEVLVPVG